MPWMILKSSSLIAIAPNFNSTPHNRFQSKFATKFRTYNGRDLIVSQIQCSHHKFRYTTIIFRTYNGRDMIVIEFQQSPQTSLQSTTNVPNRLTLTQIVYNQCKWGQNCSKLVCSFLYWMPTRQKCQIFASNQLQSPRIHPSMPWNASKLVTIDPNALPIVTNCLVCLRIAPTMSQIHRNWSEINANRLKLLCSFPNCYKFAFQAIESSSDRRKCC